MFAQTAFGIVFSTPRQFAELDTASDELIPECAVSIEWGDVPTVLENPTLQHNCWQTTACEYLLNVPDVARFHVTKSSITVSPCPQAGDSTVCLYLFGSAMGALLHLNGVLPLHGSAVCLPQDEGAAVFTGVSAAGKSTLAAALTRRGYRLIADDISAIRETSDRLMIHPGLARSKLWRKSADFLCLDPAEGSPVRPDKYAFGMAIVRQPAPITRVYELSLRDGGNMSISTVEGVEKVRLIDRHIFRRNYLAGFRPRGQHLQRVAKLARQVRASHITRPQSKEMSVDAMMDLLEQDWAQ